MSKRHFAIYGNTILRREYCPYCKGFSFIIDNMFQCCERKIDNEKTTNKKIMCEALAYRKRPSKQQQTEIVNRQNGKCLYCGVIFGTPLWRETTRKIVYAKLCFDHFVPFSYSYNNKRVNFVAACHVCNGIKSNKIFNTIEEVSDYVRYHRTKKGYKTFEEVNV